MTAVLAVLGGRAEAAVRFAAPAGWTVDDAKAKALYADFVAVDRRTHPVTTMIGKHLPTPMAAPSEAAARDFIAGAQQRAPTTVEVRHDFPEIAGAASMRVITDVTIGALTARQVSYLMPAGDQTAVITVVTGRDEFDARLAEFDEIARATRGITATRTPAEQRAYRLGLVVGRILGTLLVLGALFFAVRALTRRLNKPRA